MFYRRWAQEVLSISQVTNEEEEVTEIKPEEASIEELESQLAIAIEEEDYELASKLRDLINKKTS